MNTTKLISHWSMSGALHDVHGRFRATDDILAVIENHEPTPEPTRPAGSSYLIKGSDEENWQSAGE
jgi:hypothetical protein